MDMLISLDLLIRKYMEHIRNERRLSENSVDRYSRVLSQYAGFVNEGGMSDFLTPQPEELQRYLEGLRDRRGPMTKAKPATLASHIHVLRPFYRWLVLRGDATSRGIRYVLDMETPKIDEELRFVLSEQQMRQLLDAPRRGWNRERDKAILEILYSSGCRVSELTDMRLENLDLNAGSVRCKVKGGSERYLFLGRYAAAAIILYLTGKRPLLVEKKPDSPWLFVSPLTGGRISRITVFSIIQRHGKAIGLEGKVTPHTVRRSAATHLLMSGADIRSVMSFLGHHSIGATQKYLRLDPTHLKRTHENCHPHGANGHPPSSPETGMKQLIEMARWPDVPTHATTSQQQPSLQ